MQNLSAEMKRYGVTSSNLASVVGKNERTIRDKLSGKTEFTIPEVFKIRNTFFPGMRIEYLFADENDLDLTAHANDTQTN